MKYVVIAKDRNGKKVGEWTYNDEYYAKQTKLEKQRQGYSVELIYKK